MFKRLLGGGKSSGDQQVATRKSKKGESPFGEMKSRDKIDREGQDPGQIALASAERQLYKYKMPELERGFGDLLDAHPKGAMFPFANINTQPTEDPDARLRRLENMSPVINVKPLKVPDVVSVKLFKETENFPIESLLSLSDPKVQSSQAKQAKRGNSMDYILIRRVAIILAPLSSFIDSHSDVIVTIMDMRKRTNQRSRSLVLQDNKRYSGEFTLDYCFPKASAEKISMTFSQEIPTYVVGEQWGACQMFMELEESDFPQQAAFQETIGTASLTHSMLENYEYDPAHINLAIRDNHRAKLREMYLAGQISDGTVVKSDRTKKATYARSSGAGLKQAAATPKKVDFDQDGNIDWNTVMSFQNPEIPDDQVSLDPEESVDEELEARLLAAKDLKAQSHNIDGRILTKKEGKKVARFDVPEDKVSPPSSDGKSLDEIPLGYDPGDENDSDSSGAAVKTSKLSGARFAS